MSKPLLASKMRPIISPSRVRMASGLRDGDTRTSPATRCISPNCSDNIACNRAPSARRASTKRSIVCSQLLIKACSRAPRTAGASTALSPASKTPLMERIAAVSSRAPPVSSVTRAAALMTSASTLSLRRTVPEPTWRSVVSVRVTLPRVTRLDKISRAAASTASKPGGTRKRTSRPRPLTLRASHTQFRPSVEPSPRANPVILEIAIVSVLPRLVRLEALCVHPGARQLSRSALASQPW